jgi:hypothetical protein
MSDQFDALLRQRMTRLLAAVPPEPVPEIRPRRTPGRGILRRRLVLAVGLGLLLLTALVVSLPTLSKPTYEAQLRALGVPEGVEIGAVSGGPDGLDSALYRDKDGQAHCVGRCWGISWIDPSGRVLYEGPPGPKATPTPRS